MTDQPDSQPGRSDAPQQDAVAERPSVPPPSQAPPPPPAYTPSPQQAYPQQAYPQQGYPQQGYPQQGYHAAARQTSTSAIVGFVLSIASWVICPVIPAIVALVLANKAEREVAASSDRLTDSGLVLPTKIIAWINIGVVGAVIVVGGIIAVTAALLSN
ncbi:MAG: DUF4190 domain-containing protein [Candidatus Nanopelagicales bacterium]|jgi:hypothetical protein|nr:hypothetical protein [Candidatus Nanopelagicales bacterium]MDP4824595.1 hypothetical protein [Candidatus Nanopelagicales bacterium]MDP4888302.1 hypothetical protein [Candidatus Nanopelagicales bacterium]